MKRQVYIVILVALWIFSVAAIFPAAVQAAPSIGFVSPSLIVNDINNTITITGTGFDNSSQVSIGGTTLSTSYRSDWNDLLAIIPSGFMPGTYDITVTNPGGTSSPLSGGLTIVAPTPTPLPSSTPLPTSTTIPFARPQIVIDTYTLSVPAVRYGQDFTLEMRLDNAGGSTAYGIQVTFTSTNLLMLKNGGVISKESLGVVGKIGFSQVMTAAASLVGENRVNVEMSVSYFDDKGAPYTDKFTLIFPVSDSSYGGYTYPATTTPTGLRRSQLVVTNYKTDVDPLQPGEQFSLNLSIQNTGSMAAKGVTMILGGGSSSGGGTPQAGISGGSGEFTNFAPVGSSNIQALGDIQAGAVMPATQKLVVNVSTNPGAYPVKIGFSYQDQAGNPVNDEQVITLLVYSLPSVEVSFYQPVGDVIAGQPAALPLQVVSMGKRTAVLGMMRLSSTGGLIDNSEALVGSLDPGGYFTLDAMITPEAAGPLNLDITIDYIDDFNQPRSLTQTLTLNALDMPLEPTLDPSMSVDGGDMNSSGSGETFWSKAWRFLLGILWPGQQCPGEYGSSGKRTHRTTFGSQQPWWQRLIIHITTIQ